MALDLEDPDGALSRAVRDARSGDPHALDDALTMLHPVIRRFLERRFGGAADLGDFVSDITQDALIRVARALPSCQATAAGQVRAWALQVARSAALDYLRAPSGGLSLLRRAVQLDAQAAEAVLWTEWQRPEDEPTEASAATILCRFAVEAQDTLPATLVRLIWTRLVDGASWTEIAAQFGTTAAGAKRRYQRAQDAVRRAVLRRVADSPPQERARLTRFLTSGGRS